jgi:SNF2 family DNA or RNA helicase
MDASRFLGDDEPDVMGEKPAPSICGKLEMFGELLEEVLDGGHRVLVFCQFTTVLGLLGEELSAQGIEFCYLHGATRDRAQEVERFKRETSTPVFLISLKAGGVGLNLTAADTVIHFDPWWNPAVEVQATARAHRIGQGRVVTSYKLTTRGTVEEKNTEPAEPPAGAVRGDAGRRGTTGGNAELGGNPGSARRVNRKRT